METTAEKYVIPISASNLYDIDYAKAMRLLKEVKRRCQSEKNTSRQSCNLIESNTQLIQRQYTISNLK